MQQLSGVGKDNVDNDHPFTMTCGNGRLHMELHNRRLGDDSSVRQMRVSDPEARESLESHHEACGTTQMAGSCADLTIRDKVQAFEVGCFTPRQ